MLYNIICIALILKYVIKTLVLEIGNNDDVTQTRHNNEKFVSVLRRPGIVPGTSEVMMPSDTVCKPLDYGDN